MTLTEQILGNKRINKDKRRNKAKSTFTGNYTQCYTQIILYNTFTEKNFPLMLLCPIF